MHNCTLFWKTAQFYTPWMNAGLLPAWTLIGFVAPVWVQRRGGPTLFYIAGRLSVHLFCIGTSTFCVCGSRGGVVHSLSQLWEFLLLEQCEKGSFLNVPHGPCCFGDHCYPVFFFFFPFHLELLRCWVSYLSKWEKERKLSEMVSLEYILHCRDASVYYTERWAVIFARSWRKKKKKRNAQLWESFVSCSLFPSSPIYLCI